MQIVQPVGKTMMKNLIKLSLERTHNFVDASIVTSHVSIQVNYTIMKVLALLIQNSGLNSHLQDIKVTSKKQREI